jgi:hypothetical protein
LSNLCSNHLHDKKKYFFLSSSSHFTDLMMGMDDVKRKKNPKNYIQVVSACDSSKPDY